MKGKNMLIDNNNTIINIRYWKDRKDEVFYLKVFKDNFANPLLFFFMRRLLK
jgi:hypothetical protein|tara:strand:+ start:25 stop:180 length:156 start_codon:yes stop_codon:yes gene_type:complete